jgi:hypothetical protein
MNGNHVGFIPGFRLPCRFYEYKGDVVIPDLNGRVTLMDKSNQIFGHLGDSREADNQFPLRGQTRDKFVPGEFFCPHGTCFDHAGNILVVEWVEVGRVTKQGSV